MRFQILAPAALLAGLASAVPTNSSISIFPIVGFGGDSISWPIDGKCHDLDDQAPKLDMVGSVRLKGDIICHLYDEVNCNGNTFNIAPPGVLNLEMIMKWASRTHSIMCEKASSLDN
ncbi:hypothetical protein NLG97_g8609 [Lecanicillium saksenae]|uniref:Uncharacterized protein n=1 Tax=Lecanicillium saksenae TaxID=468837 RepID=A0ACC1QLF3_9HYPO|nr:hypothetical protein NLG97_g8609 [Lecanicillium saksenae]